MSSSSSSSICCGGDWRGGGDGEGCVNCRFGMGLEIRGFALSCGKWYVYCDWRLMSSLASMASPERVHLPATTFKTPPSTAMISPLTYLFLARNNIACAISSSCPPLSAGT